MCSNFNSMGIVRRMGFNKGQKMNEQFKELLARHIAPPALAVDRDEQGQHTAHVTYTVSQVEMDALLSAVVQECADVVRYYYIQGGEPITPQHITRHFGVEE